LTFAEGANTSNAPTAATASKPTSPQTKEEPDRTPLPDARAFSAMSRARA
jgi:hypothetical protein